MARGDFLIKDLGNASICLGFIRDTLLRRWEGCQAKIGHEDAGMQRTMMPVVRSKRSLMNESVWRWRGSK